MATTITPPKPVAPTPTFVAPKPAVAPIAPKSATVPPVPMKAVQPPIVRQPTVIGKTVKDLRMYSHGSVFVVDLLGTDDNHYFIKTKQGVLEVGGTQDWDTGIKS